jgi:Arc/MetJ-type ribon-helix-helix transcriptional regulator
MKEEKKTISLPGELYGKIEQRIAGTEFSSVDEYVNFVLEEVLKEEESETSFSKEDEEEVKRRLKGLGYLD